MNNGTGNGGQYRCCEGYLTWDFSTSLRECYLLCFLRQLILKDKDPVYTNRTANERRHAQQDLNRKGHIQSTYTGT